MSVKRIQIETECSGKQYWILQRKTFRKRTQKKQTILFPVLKTERLRIEYLEDAAYYRQVRRSYSISLGEMILSAYHYQN